jgi:hypothetical protein
VAGVRALPVAGGFARGSRFGGQSYRKELPDWTSYPPPRGSLTTSAWPPASGGTLFGKVAFNPSLSLIGSKLERGKVGGTTWNRFNALNAASFVVAAATWLPQRFGLTGERRHTCGHATSCWPRTF